ncbi:hypothetical protein [Streptomyces canus]|uniref:hypothetical protein n=1 Tax=Streptomyces canus TaxID=58343 RepID=UPI000371411B|nr:hypothetical protein [Streptomyces canus]
MDARGHRHGRRVVVPVPRLSTFVCRRLSTFLSTPTRVTSSLRWAVTDTEDGTPALAWHFDTGVLKAEAAVDGWYALLTSVPADQADAGRTLIHCKGQSAVERRCHDFKGPLDEVTPLFVQHNRRVAALIQVICLGCWSSV